MYVRGWVRAVMTITDISEGAVLVCSDSCGLATAAQKLNQNIVSLLVTGVVMEVMHAWLCQYLVYVYARLLMVFEL